MKILEFLKDDEGRYSLTRLLVLMSFPPATWIALHNPTEGIFGIYVGSFVLGYIGGRTATAWEKRPARAAKSKK